MISAIEYLDESKTSPSPTWAIAIPETANFASLPQSEHLNSVVVVCFGRASHLTIFQFLISHLCQTKSMFDAFIVSAPVGGTMTFFWKCSHHGTSSSGGAEGALAADC